MKFFRICLVFIFSFIAVFSLRSSAQSIQLVKNGNPQFIIVTTAGADSNENKAAAAFQKYIREISGAMIPISQKKANRSIFIGKASPFYNQLSKSSYSWKTDRNLHLVGATSYQTLETVYAFLEEVLGCKFLSPSVEIIPKRSDIVISESGIRNSQSGIFSYNPRITTRTVHARIFYDNPEFAAKRRVTTEGFPTFVPEARVHTFHRFIPEKQYYRSNPEFYALVKGKRIPTQVCLSNDTVYRMIRDSVKVFFERYPQSKVISVSQDDNTQYCTCDRCTAVDEKEGTPAASMILFVNRIAKEYPNKTISTLAYQYTRRAPKTLKEI